MRSARGRRGSPGSHAERRGRASISSFQVLVFVCMGAAVMVSMMWYHEYQYLTAGSQPAPGLRGGGEGEGRGAAPPNGGGGGGGDITTSSRQVGFVDVGGRIGSGEDTDPPVGNDAGGEGMGDGDKAGIGVGGSAGACGNGGADGSPGAGGCGSAGGSYGGDGGSDGGGGGGGSVEGGVPDSKAKLLEPSDDDDGANSGDATDKGEQGSADSQQTQDGNGEGETAVVVSQELEPVEPAEPGEPVERAENNVGQDEDGVGGKGAAERGAAPGGGGGLGGAVLDDLDPDTVMREERRARLNGAVEAAVARKGDSACNVAFVKTHKTASTTLAGVLYRYGLRHGRMVARFHVEGTAVTLEHAVQETKESGKRVEIFHYHYVWDGYLRSTWEEAKEHFEDIMVQPGADAAGGVGRAGGGDGTRFVTVLRDPVEHWLSYFYFYYEPEMKVGVEDYFKLGKHKKRPLNNPLAAEFGIYSERDLDEFILNHLPGFALTMLTEEVDEGLVLLGKVMDWDPIDLTYASLLEARDGATRWDDKPITRAPRPKDLHGATLDELGRVTNLDKALYEAAKREYLKVKEQYSQGLEEEVEKFRELQGEVLAVLNEGVGRGGRVSPARAWYMPESDYFFYSTDKTKWYTEEDYYPDPLPF